MDATSSFPIPARGPDFEIVRCKEPTISELLADPLTRALMRADHVDIPAFEQMLDSVAGRFRDGGRAARPVLALKTSAGVKPNPPMPAYFTWTAIDRNIGSDAARSAYGAIGAKISDIVCGSHCSW